MQLLLFNEESLVSASHQLALITSLPFVHTARRYYRLNGSVRPSDWLREVGNDHPEVDSGVRAKDAAGQVAKKFGLSKRDVYEAWLHRE